jgi:hypothetical protein
LEEGTVIMYAQCLTQSLTCGKLSVMWIAIVNHHYHYCHLKDAEEKLCHHCVIVKARVGSIFETYVQMNTWQTGIQRDRMHDSDQNNLFLNGGYSQ